MQIHDRTSTANIHQLGKNTKINCSSISDHLPLWRALLENYDEFILLGGETGFDEQESKLPTFWNTSFSKICLGMKINQQLKFTVIYKLADSLHSLIADGQYRKTFLGRDGRKKLIGSNASLQHNCNEEGFKAFSDRSIVLKSELVSSAMTRTTVNHATLWLGLVQEVIQEAQNLAETRHTMLV